MTLNEILVGKPDPDRDLMLAEKVKNQFIQGTKICIISPSMGSMHKYNNIVSRCKAFDFEESSGVEIHKHIDAAFDDFLEMGFAQPLSHRSLLVIEDFGRLLWRTQGNERLMNRLSNIIALANKQEIFLWIVADSHEIISYPKYKTALKEFMQSYT